MARKQDVIFLVEALEMYGEHSYPMVAFSTFDAAQSFIDAGPGEEEDLENFIYIITEILFNG